MGSSLLAIPLMIFSESIQARYLGPEKYGQVALVLSISALFFRFGLSWLRLSIMRFGKEEFIKTGHLRKTTSNFFLISLFSFFLVFLLFLTFSEKILNFLELQNSIYFWLISAGIVLLIFKNFVLETLKVLRMIKAQTVLMRFASKLFVVAGMLFFILQILQIRIIYVVGIFLLSDFLIVLIGFLLIKKKYIFPFILNRELLGKMLLFSFPLLFSSWSEYFITWIDTYLIKYFLTLKEVGIYQAAYKILNTMRSFSFTAITTITMPIIMVFKTNQQNHKIENIYLQRLLPQLSFFAMLLIGVILLFSDIGFNLVYGSEFNNSILPFKILITTLHLGIVAIAFKGVQISYDMTKYFLYFGIISAVVNTILDILLIPVLGILGAAIATFFVFTINPLMWFLLINHKFSIKRKLALFFPLFSFALLAVNILFSSFVIKLIFTVILPLISFLIAKKFNLFNKKDINILNQIQLPQFVKIIYTKIIEFAD
jgi:O-antigen/teichoic acid export membrane protein